MDNRETTQRLLTQFESEKKDNTIRKLENDQLRSSQRLSWYGFAMALLIVIVLFLWMRQRQVALKQKVLKQELEVEQSRVKDILKQQEINIVKARFDATESERKQLSYFLHDTMAGSLSGIMHFVDGIHVSATDTALKNELQEVRERMQLLYSQARSLSHDLHPPSSPSEEKPFDAEFERFIKYQLVGSDIQLMLFLDNPGDLKNLDAQRQMLLYRIAQEAMANIFKHAHAKNVSIESTTEDGKLILRICDDGVGFDASKPASSGIGLRNMRE
jgi:signal transduction histidine kinase